MALTPNRSESHASSALPLPRWPIASLTRNASLMRSASLDAGDEAPRGAACTTRSSSTAVRPTYNETPEPGAM